MAGVEISIFSYACADVSQHRVYRAAGVNDEAMHGMILVKASAQSQEQDRTISICGLLGLRQFPTRTGQERARARILH